MTPHNPEREPTEPRKSGQTDRTAEAKRIARMREVERIVEMRRAEEEREASEKAKGAGQQLAAASGREPQPPPAPSDKTEARNQVTATQRPGERLEKLKRAVGHVTHLSWFRVAVLVLLLAILVVALGVAAQIRASRIEVRKAAAELLEQQKQPVEIERRGTGGRYVRKYNWRTRRVEIMQEE